MFIAQLAPFAVKHGLVNGVLPSLILSQGILESDFGTSDLAVNANNLFGIKKGSGWTGPIYTKITPEQNPDGTTYYIPADFRKYSTIEGCVIDLVHKYTHGTGWEDHNRYAAVLNQADYRKATAALHAAGYATDIKYATKLNERIEQYGLTKYDKEVDSVVKIIDLRPITPRTNGTRKESAIKKIARHHSATATGSWESFWPHWNKTRGWGTGGYHEIILRNGDVQLCYDPHEITNGVKNHNSTTYHICVVGNGSFTEAQEKVFDERAKLAMKRFGLSVADVLGHNEFSGTSTDCPGIDMNTVRNRLKGNAVASTVVKGVTEMAFSSPALKAETELTIGSRARREIIVKAAVEAGAHKSWLEKLENGKITDMDILGLSAKYTVDTNK